MSVKFFCKVCDKPIWEHKRIGGEVSWQNCPHCGGAGSVGFVGIPCPVCFGKRIIDDVTGKPPILELRVQND